MQDDHTFTAFRDGKKIGSGDRETVASIVESSADDFGSPIVILSDLNGQVVDLAPLGPASLGSSEMAAEAAPKTGRGRPKLGVVAREVTLLPRHWEWLGSQPGGASAALRRLVDQARRESLGAGLKREARDAAYRAMTTLAGNLAGYEEALRCLYADDRTGFLERTSAWTPDIRDYVRAMAAGGWETFTSG